MISAPSFTISGQPKQTVNLPAQVFGVKPNPTLLAQAVRIYLGNRRRTAAKTKTRGEVAGSTRKIFKQKGTGRARHGAIRAPIFVGGGIAHGPAGNQNYSASLPTVMRRQAMLGSLSAKAAAKQVVVVSPDRATGKTGQVTWLADSQSMLVVTTLAATKFNLAVRNLDRTDVLPANQLNAYAVLAHTKLVIIEPALEELVKMYAA